MITNGELPDGESQFIDQVIAEYLQAEAEGRAGDRQRWLERFPACASALNEFLDDREQINRLVAPIERHRNDSIRFALSDVVPADGTEDVQTVELAPPAPKLSTTRYSPVRFHAKGGMGEIWLAKDERVGRHVALKKLRSGRENQHLRFVAEAQITGQLEHPSVVPLHDIGMDDTGQPFYVMKFIHGRRLKEAIAEFHAEKEPVDWASNVGFRRLLENFVNVCNVVAYAHHKGVVHRDIKPDNILLGPYGEVVVVDWGLAKLVGQEDEHRGSAVRLSGSGSTATQEGAIVGSPFYMSPEGAKGQPDAVDEASDVYLLGATLYEILCARPPRQAASSWELIDLALHSRPKPPRSVDPSIPKPLEAICLKALAFDKQDRYSSPLQVASDVERYLAGAEVSAYAEPFFDRAQRWIRRRRRGLGIIAVASLLVAVAGYAVEKQRAASLLAAREEARGSLDEYQRLANEAQFFAANTDAISERVPYYDPRRAAEAGSAALAIADPWGQKAEGLPLDERRPELLQSQYDLLLLMAQAKQHSVNPGDSPQEVLAILDRARTLTTPTRSYFSLRAECLASLGESQAAELDRKRAAAPSTPVTAQDYFIAGEKLRLLDANVSAQALGDANLQSSLRREHLLAALAEYQHALELDPQHFWARFQSGRCLLALGRSPEAIEALSGCIAMRPDMPWAYTTRGLACAIDGRYEDALGDLNQAIKLDPEFQPAHLNRGLVHWLNGDDERAIDDFTKVLDVGKDERLCEAALYRGQLLLNQEKLREAEADFTLVIEARPELRIAYWYRSQARFRSNQSDTAIADIETFVAMDPQHTDSASLAAKHLALGKALRSVAQQVPVAERAGALQAAADELQAAIAAGPATAEMWRHLGAVRELSKAFPQAIDAYTRGLALDPHDSQLRNMRAWTSINANKKLDPAMADFQAVLAADPGNAEARVGLGFVLAELGKEDESRREASAALIAAADNHLILHNVACIYARLSTASPKRTTEYENLAIASLQRAVAISRANPTGPDANEIALIRKESSFPESLKSRDEFQNLVNARQGR